jgi:hypothetical protein
LIQAFASDAPEKSFAHGIHQGSLNRGAQHANPGACGDSVEDSAELVVAIADDELRLLPEGRRVAQLLRGPRLRRRPRHRDMHDTLGVHIDDEEREDGTEPYVIGLQEIARPNRVVAEERSPALSAPRSRRPHASHVALNRSLRDPNAELQEFAANALGSPKSAPGRHALDKGDDIRSEARFARIGQAGLSTPEEPKSLAVPPKHGLRFDQEQRVAPAGKESREQHEQAALVASKAGAFDTTRGDDELLAKKCVLGERLTARTRQIRDKATRDCRWPARVAQRARYPDCEAGSDCGKPGAQDAEHRSIRANPKPIIKARPREIPNDRTADGESSRHRPASATILRSALNPWASPIPPAKTCAPQASTGPHVARRHPLDVEPSRGSTQGSRNFTVARAVRENVDALHTN